MVSSWRNKEQDWKQKKGYTPLIVLTTVLLVLAFYAGQSRGSNVAGGTTRGATATASLTYSSTSSGKLVSPKELAKAWKEYDNGAYKGGCANAMAIALGEGLIGGPPEGERRGKGRREEGRALLGPAAVAVVWQVCTGR